MPDKKESLQKKHENLQRIHHQALHELAGAAQMVKSYEFLLEEYEEENHALMKILRLAEDLSKAADYDIFLAKRTKLLKAIARYHSKRRERISWSIPSNSEAHDQASSDNQLPS